MLKKILLGLVALIIILYFAFNTIVTGAVETLATETLGTEVTVGSIGISPFSQSVTVSNLKVANPQGFDQPTILEIPRISITAESIFGDSIVMEDITVSGLKVTYELSGTRGSNIRVLQKNLKKSASSSSSSPAATDQKSDNGESKKVIIRQLLIENAKLVPAISVGGKGQSTEIDIPTIRMKNIGSEKKSVTPEEAIQKVLSKVLASANSVSSKALIEGAKKKIKDTLRNLF